MSLRTLFPRFIFFCEKGSTTGAGAGSAVPTDPAVLAAENARLKAELTEARAQLTFQKKKSSIESIGAAA